MFLNADNVNIVDINLCLLNSDPYAESSEDSENEGDNGKKPMLIDIDLDLSAFANATK